MVIKMSRNEETNLQARIMAEISAMRLPCMLLRNNVGQGRFLNRDGTSSFVRYGVGGPGGADFIGARQILITQEMVGKVIAQLVAMEIKTVAGNLQQNQQDFLDAVNVRGGMAFVARSSEEAIKNLQMGI